MSDPIWPAVLPQVPIKDGYSEEPQDNVVRSQPDAGPGKSRRRYTAIGVSTGVSYKMSESQVQTFITFWRDSIFDGSIPYKKAHHRTGVEKRFKATAPYKLASHQGGGGKYVVTLFLKELP